MQDECNALNGCGASIGMKRFAHQLVCRFDVQHSSRYRFVCAGLCHDSERERHKCSARIDTI